MNLKKRVTLISLLILIIPAITRAQSSVILSLEGDTFCAGTSKNVILCHLQNSYNEVSSIQFDLLFDTDCFSVTDVRFGNRTYYGYNKEWSHVENGIRMSITGKNRILQPGSGSILTIYVDVHRDCPEGEHLWRITDSQVKDSLGAMLHSVDMSELISTSVCSTCVLRFSRKAFHMGEACILGERKEPLNIRNIGVETADIIIETSGCADANATSISIEPASSKALYVLCRPQSEDLCEGALVLTGCGGETAIEVSCYGVQSERTIVFVDNTTTFSLAENNSINLMLRNCHDNVSVLHVDLSFNTDYFTVTEVWRPSRVPCDIFSHSQIENGIRIAITCLGHTINAGTGPVANIIFDTNNAPEGQHSWTITSSVAANPLGNEIPLIEGDGIVTVLSCQRGDVDNNCTVNVIDVFWALRIVLDELPNPTPRQLEAADCNDDGVVDVTDVICIVNAVLGLGTCPP
jgi:hypothetical protein